MWREVELMFTQIITDGQTGEAYVEHFTDVHNTTIPIYIELFPAVLMIHGPQVEACFSRKLHYMSELQSSTEAFEC